MSDQSDIEKVIKCSEIVAKFGEKKLEDYSGWPGFAVHLIEAYIEHRKIALTVDILTYESSLENFFERYRHYITVLMFFSNIKDIANHKDWDKQIFNGKVKGALPNYIIADTFEILLDDIIIYSSTPENVGTKFQLDEDEKDCAWEEFNLREFAEDMTISQNRDYAHSRLITLFELCSFIDGDIFEDEYAPNGIGCNTEEIYPLILDKTLHSYFQKSDKDTRGVIEYANRCKDNPMKKLQTDDWVRLYKKDKTLIESNREYRDKNIRNFIQYYDVCDLDFIDDRIGISFLQELYYKRELFLFKCEDIKPFTEFFDALSIMDSKHMEMLFKWIHRYNLILCGCDESGELLKEYSSYMENPSKGRGKDIFESVYWLEEDDEEEHLTLEEIMGGKTPNNHAEEKQRAFDSVKFAAGFVGPEDEEDNNPKRVNLNFSFTDKTKGAELACLLAALIAARKYEFNGRPEFIKYLQSMYPHVIDEKISKAYLSRLNDTLSNKDLSIIKDQCSLLEFVSGLYKQPTKKEKMKKLATSLFLELKNSK